MKGYDKRQNHFRNRRGSNDKGCANNYWKKPLPTENRNSNNSFSYNPQDQDIFRELQYAEIQKSVSSEETSTKTLVGVQASSISNNNFDNEICILQHCKPSTKQILFYGIVRLDRGW